MNEILSCYIGICVYKQLQNLNVFRYEVRERLVRGGIVSELIISTTVSSDSGGYTCIATNPYGRAQGTIRLQVQGPYCQSNHTVLFGEHCEIK